MSPTLLIILAIGAFALLAVRASIRRGMVAAAFALAAPYAPALAQDDTPPPPSNPYGGGSHLPPTDTGENLRNYESKDARRTLDTFAACVVIHSHAGAVHIVVDRPDFDKEPAALKVLDPGCLGFGTLAIPPVQLRGALSEALIKSDLPVIWAGDFKDVAPLSFAPPEPFTGLDKRGRPLAGLKLKDAQDGYRETLAAHSLDSVGECAVRANPIAARMVLNTKVASAEETMALQAIAPAFSQCIDRGSTFELKREALRATLATSFYTLAMASRGRRRVPPVSAMVAEKH